jgi:hypothetical protein
MSPSGRFDRNACSLARRNFQTPSYDVVHVAADRQLFRPLNESGWSQSCCIHPWQT